MKFPRFTWLLLGAIALLAGGCGRKESRSPDHDHAHHHHAPNGGTLVELGHHQFNLEFVHDAAAGTLTVHVLNAHAEDTVRLDAREVPIVVTTAGGEKRLSLRPVENRLSNETVGDTSVFSAPADWLKAASGLAGSVPEITVRGLRFEQVRFTLPGNVSRK